jgi:hypothetical protein
MSADRIAELIDRLERIYAEARAIEEELCELGIETPPLTNGDAFKETHRRLKQRQLEESVCFALQRIDFRDDFYHLIRGIDGDTIVVEPPRNSGDTILNLVWG